MSKQLKDFNPRVVQTRATSIAEKKVDEDKRAISAAISSETVVKRLFGTEKLLHRSDAINLEYANPNGLPLLFHHDPTKPIGRVRNIKLDKDGKLRGQMIFSDNPKAQEIYNDVRADMLSDVSVGYTVDEWNETNSGIEATRWTPREVSITAIPHDASVGVGRSLDANDNLKRGDTMSDTDKKAIANAAVDDYIKREKTRKADIEAVFTETKLSGDSYDKLKTRAFDDETMTVDLVRAELLKLVSHDAQSHSSPNVQFGTDSADKFDRAVMDSLKVRTDQARDKELIKNIRQNEFFGFSMVEIARRCLEVNGLLKPGMSRMEVVGTALTMRAIHGVADFPNILANVANGSMQLAYEETPETWRAWCRVGNLSDFKVTDRPNLSAFDDLPVVADKASYTYGSFSDLKETIQLATYGKIFQISRQALINDNLDGLGRIPAAMGRAAARTVGALPYAILEANAAMNQDSNPLFDPVNHTNDNDDAGAGPTVAHIETGRVAMANQTDPSGNATLGVLPRWLLVPTEYGTQARTLMKAEYEPGTAPGNLQPNPFQSAMDVIEEHRIDPGDWFMAGSINQVETIEVAFLDGQDSPTLEQDDPWTYDGTEMKVRIDAAAQALDYRGLQRFSNLP